MKEEWNLHINNFIIQIHKFEEGYSWQWIYAQVLVPVTSAKRSKTFMEAVNEALAESPEEEFLNFTL